MIADLSGQAQAARPPAPCARLWLCPLPDFASVLLVAVLVYGAGYRLEAAR